MGRPKKEIKMKQPVRIREKKLANGNVSLYLDTYYKGVRKKETLNLYLVPEVDAAAKLQNANARRLAEEVKAKRIIDLQNCGMVNWKEALKPGISLVEWLKEYVSGDDGASPATLRSRRNTNARVLEYLNQERKQKILLKDVDKDFCKGFIAFLDGCTFNKGRKKLCSTTKRIFVSRLTSALEKAVVEGKLDRNPFKLLDAREKPRKRNSVREFLTIEELKALMDTPCRYEIVKQAFLFSCFTGLRYSDMKSLKWSEIHTAADGCTRYIDHEQVKTKRQVIIPLSEEALRWMPANNGSTDVVFHQLKITSTTVEVVLGEWMVAAGITKHITYHCSRHTAATTLITLGADLYTVSKILGHSSIRITEQYAKIVDTKKIETMNLVNKIYDKYDTKQ